MMIAITGNVEQLISGTLPEWCGGYGYGSGSGYGYGSGDGDGDGFGDGSGDGYGSGSGYGSKEYWLATVQYFAAQWTPAQRGRLRVLCAAGATIAFWRSNEDGQPSNGGQHLGTPAGPGVIHSAPGPLTLCRPGTLHASLLPSRWRGARTWIVALIGEVVGGEEKYGALRREVIGEALRSTSRSGACILKEDL